MKRFMSVVAITAAVVLTGPAIAQAKPYPAKIVLPGATSAEGIAVGRGSTFFAGDLFAGDLYKGDLRSGEAELFVDAPEGRMAIGMGVDGTGRLLFVAGGFSGQAYVYDTRTGAELAAIQLADPSAGPVINDVAITADAAWFTDSAQPHLYRVPIGPRGQLGEPRILTVTGPAADTSGEFNLNGIAASRNGKTLLVAHSNLQQILKVDPRTGASRAVVDVGSPDGILLDGHTLIVVENMNNRLARVELSHDYSRGTIDGYITSDLFRTPTTVARHGSRLAVINAHFETGIPPTAPEYEVIIVRG